MTFPRLYLLFSFNTFFKIIMPFMINKIVHGICLGKSINQIVLMLVNSLHKTGCHSNIERSVVSRCQYINMKFFHNGTMDPCLRRDDIS